MASTTKCAASWPDGLLEGLQTRLGYLVQGDAEIFLMRLAAEYQALMRADSPAPLDLPQS